MSESLWDTFRDAVGFEPKRGSAEWKGWRTIIAQWTEQGFTPVDVRRMVRGFAQAHPTQPATPWKINESPSAYMALVTPRDVRGDAPVPRGTTDTHGVIDVPDAVPPPDDVVRQFETPAARAAREAREQ